MSTFSDDLTAEQDPDPDSPEPECTEHAEWVSQDQHHFDHNIADARWADVLNASQEICMSLADRMLRHLCPQATAKLEVSVLWTDDQHIAALNSQFRQKSGPTNILSFPSGEPISWQSGQVFLGDLVLGYETVATEAEDMGKSLSHHIAHLFLHGMLHLVGFDHINDDEAAEMEALETSLLAAIGIADPYTDISPSEGETGLDRSLLT